jgi:hypothetical protein
LTGMPNWLLRLAQLSIASVVAGAAAAFKWTENPMLIGVWALAAAYFFTLAYEWLWSRWRGAYGTLTSENEELYGIPGEDVPLFRPGKFTENPGPLWIGNQARNLIDITPEPPTLDNVPQLGRDLKASTSGKRGRGAKG